MSSKNTAEIVALQCFTMFSKLVVWVLVISQIALYLNAQSVPEPCVKPHLACPNLAGTPRVWINVYAYNSVLCVLAFLLGRHGPVANFQNNWKSLASESQLTLSQEQQWCGRSLVWRREWARSVWARSRVMSLCALRVQDWKAGWGMRDDTVLRKRRKVIGSMQRSCSEGKQNFC